MFTWICPQCGREVSPSESECPNCAGKVQRAPQAPAPAEAAVTAEEKKPARAGLPAWLLAVLSAVGVALVCLIGYGAYRVLSAPPEKPAAAKTALESPPPAPVPVATGHPLAKHIEITGFRLHEDAKQKATIQCVVVNHSGADLGDLGIQASVIAVTADGKQNAVGTFSFKVAALGPYESREVKTPLATKLRVYELPDWQFLRADFRITSPAR